MKTYGSTEIQKGLGITKSQAIHWTQIGAVIPHENAQGRGGRRRYSLQNVFEFAICRELSLFGIPTYVMVNALEYLRAARFGIKTGHAPLSEIHSRTPYTDQDMSKIPKALSKELMKGWHKGEERVSFWEYLEKHKEARRVLLFVFPILPDLFGFLVRPEDDIGVHHKVSRIVIPIGLIATEAKAALE